MLNGVKKIIPIFIIILFLGFIFFGFKLAQKFFPGHQSTPLVSSPAPDELISQSNYFLFQVNDFSQKHPQLIAIWMVIDASTPSGEEIFFIPLYPSITDVEKNEQIASIFSLNKEDTVVSSAFRRLRRLFNLEIDGYFVTDNTGFLNFASIAEVEQVEIFAESPQSIEAAEHVQASGNVFFTRVCTLLTSGASNAFFSQLDLSVLMPASLTSNIPGEVIQPLFDEINQTAQIASCRIILPQ